MCFISLQLEYSVTSQLRNVFPWTGRAVRSTLCNFHHKLAHTLPMFRSCKRSNMRDYSRHGGRNLKIPVPINVVFTGQFCLGWCSNFVCPESCQKQNMVYNTTQHPPPPPAKSVNLKEKPTYRVQCLLYSSFVHGSRLAHNAHSVSH